MVCRQLVILVSCILFLQACAYNDVTNKYTFRNLPENLRKQRAMPEESLKRCLASMETYWVFQTYPIGTRVLFAQEKKSRDLRKYCREELFPNVELCVTYQTLTSPYGICIEKLQNGTIPIKSSKLESFVNDFTLYGLTHKCLLLKNDKADLENILIQHCDKDAGVHFVKSLETLNKSYSC
ncbi:hypothetical protein L3Y34_012181 [Caenorhabditis briggsae]|uniref:Uncharacterized protein n=2 Tax=Caenorhabditis briggsae TaxID=6238 RepID=A0AAE8ZS02_CAEBR|nr:hypothetical protein L3Y34_012181 [Caenorhabditis briggsae]